MISIAIKIIKYMIIVAFTILPILFSLGTAYMAYEDPNVWSYLPVKGFLFLFPWFTFAFIYQWVKKITKALLFTGLLLFTEGSVFSALTDTGIIENTKISIGIFIFLNIAVLVAIIIFKRLKCTNEVKKPKEKTIENPSRIIFDCKPYNIYLDNPYRGIYIQGGAGSGKSESIFKPIIKKIVEQKSSGVLYDFKSGELTKYLFHHLKQQPHSTKAYFIDFKNPLHSHRVNALNPKYLLKSAYAFEYSEVIINNLLPETIKERKFWDRDAQSILTGLIWYLKKHYPEFCSLPHIIALILETDTKYLLEKISSDPETSGMVVSLRQAMERGAEKQVAGVISTLQTALSRLNTPDIFWLLSGDDLDLDINNPNDPKFLCIGNDSTLPSAYAPVISLIISVSTRLMNQPNKHPSTIILDEAPTLYLPNIEQVPATGRSNKIATVFGVQDYSQMVDKYGQDKAQVILSNLGNQFYGRTSNAKTAEMIKSLFSKEDKIYWAKSRNSGSSGELIHFNTNDGKGKSQSIQERDRVKISEILKADSGHFYGLIAEGKPREFIDYKFGYDNTQIDSECITTPKYEHDTISKNYTKIIRDAKSIISNEPSNQNTLIDL